MQLQFKTISHLWGDDRIIGILGTEKEVINELFALTDEGYHLSNTNDEMFFSTISDMEEYLANCYKVDNCHDRGVDQHVYEV